MRTILRDAIPLLILLFAGSRLSAQDDVYDWALGRELHSGIRFVRIESEQPRKMVVHAARIDTWMPEIRLRTTPRRSDWNEGKAETDRQTTRDFLRQSRLEGHNMVLAFNADAFSPWPAPFNQSTPTDLLGLAAADGKVVSSGTGTPSLLELKNGFLKIAKTAPDSNISDVRLAVSGFALCLDDGQPIVGGNDLHPRTGLGLSEDQRFMVVVAIDGRQPNSRGATTQELGSWLKHFGAHRGINMDGGGSTTMAWWDAASSEADKCQLLNRPVGNGANAAELPATQFIPTERANGNNLGVVVDFPRTTHDDDHYLFVDDHWIKEQHGLTRVYNQAKPLDQPIISPDDPRTETDCAWGNVIREADGKFRLWYCTMTMGHNAAGPHEMAAAGVWGRGDDATFRPRSDADRPDIESMLGKYAESYDGLTWRKPNVGLIEFRGNKDNNVILTGQRASEQTGGALTNFDGYTILRDDHDPNQDRRYKMIAHWETVHFWDNHAVSGSLGRPQEWMDRYAAARGEYITYSPDGLRWDQPLERLESLPSGGGDRLLVVPDHRNKRWMAYVRAGGWSYPAFSYSEDLQHWTAAEPARLITPELVSAPWVECMIPFNYGNQDLGFPCGMDKPKGQFTVQLASRHDRALWNPVDQTSGLIPTGPPGSYYATGAVPLHNEPFLVGDELLIFFTAFSRNQQTPCPQGSRSIGVAKLRRDAFVGVMSSGKEGIGRLTTKPLTIHGDLLMLNVQQRDGVGDVTVALLDEQGAELPGFGFADSIPLTTDAIRVPVQWKMQTDLSLLRGKNVCVSLRMRGPAIVYALAIHDDPR
jgi:Phosphodiester glycosidase